MEKEILMVVKETLEDDKDLVDVVTDIVIKIKELKKGATTSIAELIDYNKELKSVSPLTQGKVSFYVKQVCEKMGIKIESSKDSIGGLAYFDKFKKY